MRPWERNFQVAYGDWNEVGRSTVVDIACAELMCAGRDGRKGWVMTPDGQVEPPDVIIACMDFVMSRFILRLFNLRFPHHTKPRYLLIASMWHRVESYAVDLLKPQFPIEP